MSNPSKQKGTSFETAAVTYLNENGVPCERRALHGNTDKGDISGVPDWTFEVKNRKVLDIGGAMDEARVEAGNAGTKWYAAIVKRPRKGSAGEAIVAMPLHEFKDLLHTLRSAI